MYMRVISCQVSVVFWGTYSVVMAVEMPFACCKVDVESWLRCLWQCLVVCVGISGLLWDHKETNWHAESSAADDGFTVPEYWRHGRWLCTHVWQCVQIQWTRITHLQGWFLFTSVLLTGRLPPVLCRCCLAGRKGIWPLKKLSGGMLAWYLSGSRCGLA